MTSQRHNRIEDESKTYSVALLRYGVLLWKQISDKFSIFTDIKYLILNIKQPGIHISIYFHVKKKSDLKLKARKFRVHTFRLEFDRLKFDKLEFFRLEFKQPELVLH